MSISNNDFSREFLILLLLEGNKIEGRKKLQKIVYFVNLIGWKIFHDYRFHHFGPYSDDLFKELENLSQLNLIYVIKNNSYYQHSITERGKRFLDILNQQNKYLDLVKRTRSLVKILNNFTSRELEAMSSFYFMKNEYPGLNDILLFRKLNDLKPYLKKEISNSSKILQIMNKYNK